MNPSPQTYALLIGIDNYNSSELYKDLRGCVRDVDLVDSYLHQVLKVPREHIFRLTSAQKRESTLAGVRSDGVREDSIQADSTQADSTDSAPDPQPTYEEIVRTFDEMTNMASKGDRIYIHYSGHGGRVATQYPELKDEREPDEGLVPSDYVKSGRYLRDVEIATLLKRMTDKGLIVTMSLDSCHSGGATRGDCAIRGAGEIDTKPDLRESLVGSRETLVKNWRISVGETAPTENGAHSAQIPISDGAVILAACRPNEYAFEYATDGSNRHGALTYWMIDTLNTLGNHISCRALHNRVSAKIQSRYPSQLPMLLGASERTLFGDDSRQSQYTATVLEINAALEQVTISAGLAQGTSLGARFALYPHSADLSNPVSVRSQKQAIIEVVEVAATQSTARVLSEAESGLKVALSAIEQGAPVEMLSVPVNLQRRVELFDHKPLGLQEDELPPEGADKQKEAIAAVREAMRCNGWVSESTETEQGSDYQVSIGRNGDYEICSGTPIQNLTPPLSIHQTDAPAQVVKRLVHLSKYQAVQALDNPASTIRDTLLCELLDSNRRPVPLSNPIVVKQRQRLILRMHNKGEKPLNVALLNLEPTWAISQIPIRGLDSLFYQLDKGQTVDTPLSFRMPQSDNARQKREIIKIFAACGSADFRNLLLPSLDQDFAYRGNLRARASNAFTQLLAAIGSDIESKPALTRAVVYDPDPNAEWATKQFSLLVEQ